MNKTLFYNQGPDYPSEKTDAPQGQHPPPGNKHLYRHKFFPDSVHEIPKVKADFSIPNLSDVIKNHEEHIYDKVLQILKIIILKNKNKFLKILSIN